MKNIKQLSKFGLMAALIGVSAMGQAADGTVGPDSTGSMLLRVTVPGIIVIKDVADPGIQTFDFTNDVDFSDDVCIGTNSASGYSITATSTHPGPSNEFQLSDGTNNVIYNVAWGTPAGAPTGTALTSGTTWTPVSPPVDNIGCTGGNNARVIIIVPAANLNAVPAATYQDTLSLLVNPL